VQIYNAFNTPDTDFQRGEKKVLGGDSEGLAELVKAANDNILAPRSFGHRLPFLLNPLL
jgi:hypothetical protein